MSSSAIPYDQESAQKIIRKIVKRYDFLKKNYPSYTYAWDQTHVIIFMVCEEPVGIKVGLVSRSQPDEWISGFAFSFTMEHNPQGSTGCQILGPKVESKQWFLEFASAAIDAGRVSKKATEKFEKNRQMLAQIYTDCLMDKHGCTSISRARFREIIKASARIVNVLRNIEYL